MGFIYPQVLWLLVAMVPVLVVWTFLRRAQDGRLARFMVRDNWSLLNNQVSTRARFHKGVLVLLALALSVVAAARPYWGEYEREVTRRGASIIFALDVSRSMAAEDVGDLGGVRTMGGAQREQGRANRLDAARILVRQVLAELPGQRVALMPFSGDAFIQCPMTTDYGMLNNVVRRLDFDTVGYPGTDIPLVIDTAIDAFERTGTGTRALVIFTDGEDHSDAISEAAAKARTNGIRIFAVGIGSTEGAPIRFPDGRLKEDATGLKVVTAVNPELLRDLAEATGGRAYVAGASGVLDPTPLIRDLEGLEKSDLGAEKRTVRQERYQWPLALALLCLAIEMLLHDRRRTPRPAPRAAMAGAGALMAMMLGAPAAAQPLAPEPEPAAPAQPALPLVRESEDGGIERDTAAPAAPEDSLGFTWWNDVPELVRRGNEVYREGTFDAASDQYRAAELKASATDPRILLNLGLAEARQGNFDSAARQFDRAQAFATEQPELRSEALYNLGRNRLERAMAAQAEPEAHKGVDAKEQLFGAIDALDQALDLRNGEFDAAAHNRAQAQHLLQMMSMQEQMQQQQQQPEDGEGEGEPQEGEGEQQPPPQGGDEESEGEQGEQPPQEQEGEPSDQQGQAGDEPQEQEQQQPQPQEGEEEQQQEEEQPQPAGGEEEEESQMTEEQARQLLNLLDGDAQTTLRKGRPRGRPTPEKDW